MMTLKPITLRRLLFCVSILSVCLLVQNPGHGQTVGSCGSNVIVCENHNAGSPQSEWDISGAGDDTIQGFATQISVIPGQTQQFKVDTTASAFSIDIYRMGYYGGMGAR